MPENPPQKAEEAHDELDRETDEARKEDKERENDKKIDAAYKGIRDLVQRYTTEKPEKAKEIGVDALVDKATGIIYKSLETENITLTPEEKKALEKLLKNLKKEMKNESGKIDKKPTEAPKETPETIQDKIGALRKEYNLKNSFQNMEYISELITLMKKIPRMVLLLREKFAVRTLSLWRQKTCLNREPREK